MTDMCSLRLTLDNSLSQRALRRGALSSTAALLAFGLVGACGGRTDYVFSEDSGQGDSSDTSGRTSGSRPRSGSGVGDGDGDYVDYGDGDGDGSPVSTSGSTSGNWYSGGDGDGDSYGYGYDYYGGYGRPIPGIGRPGIYDPYWYGGYGGGYGGAPRPVVEEPLLGCEVSDSYSYGKSECSKSYDCDNGTLRTNCWDGGDQIYCDCEAGRGWTSFLLERGTADSCQVAADFCAQGDVSGFGDPVCEPQWQDASSDYCSIEEQCVSETSGPGGDTIGWSDWKSTYCEKDGTSWMCNCYGGDSNLSLTFQPANGGLAACNEAGDLCEQADNFSGPLKCSADYQTASNDWCDVGLRCFQETDVNGTKVELNAWASAYCDGYGQDQWDCYCNGPGTRKSFVIDGMTDPWNSCLQAGDLCREMIEIESAD